MLTISFYPTVAASNYNVTFKGNTFAVTWKLNAWQNLTGFTGSPVFPQNVNSSATGTDLTALTQAVQAAFQAKVSTVAVSQSHLQLATNNASSSCPVTCPLQWLNVTIQLQVQDSPPAISGVARYDTSWKEASIGNDLKVAGIGYNKPGTFLIPALVPFIEFTPGLGRTLQVFVNNRFVTNSTYQAPLRNLVLMNNSFLNTPLEGWSKKVDFSSGTQVLTSPDTSNFNVTALLRISEGGTTSNFKYTFFFQSSAELSAPIGTSVHGNTLLVDVSQGFWEKIALVVLVALAIVLVGALVIERRVLASPVSRRKGKNR